MADFRGIVVPGIPPLAPPLSLINSALKPTDEADPASSKADPEQLANLPAGLRAELSKREGEDWVRGITWAPEHHREATVRDPCDEKTVIARGTNLAVQVAIPYIVLAEDACSTFGFEERDFKGRATRLLESAKHKAVEKEFATGALATAAGWPNAFLENEATVTDLTPEGGPPSVARGFQILQDGLAEGGFGGQGMIHVQRQTATNMLTVIEDDPHFIVDDDGMHDMFGNIIVPGVGYPGGAPGPWNARGAWKAATAYALGDSVTKAGVTYGCIKAMTEGEDEEPPKPEFWKVIGSPLTSWIYATDMVAFREEPEATIFPESFAEAMNWGQTAAGEHPANEANTIAFVAQKFAVTQWDVAVHLACRVTLAV